MTKRWNRAIQWPVLSDPRFCTGAYFLPFLRDDIFSPDVTTHKRNNVVTFHMVSCRRCLQCDIYSIQHLGWKVLAFQIKSKNQVQTADLLIASGRINWVTKRQGRVEAKGKCTIQTYWINTKLITTTTMTPSLSSGNNNNATTTTYPSPSSSTIDDGGRLSNHVVAVDDVVDYDDAGSSAACYLKYIRRAVLVHHRLLQTGSLITVMSTMTTARGKSSRYDVGAKMYLRLVRGTRSKSDAGLQ